jgi:hypothetical protein
MQEGVTPKRRCGRRGLGARECRRADATPGTRPAWAPLRPRGSARGFACRACARGSRRTAQPRARPCDSRGRSADLRRTARSRAPPACARGRSRAAVRRPIEHEQRASQQRAGSALQVLRRGLAVAKHRERLLARGEELRLPASQIDPAQRPRLPAAAQKPREVADQLRHVSEHGDPTRSDRYGPGRCLFLRPRGRHHLPECRRRGEPDRVRADPRRRAPAPRGVVAGRSLYLPPSRHGCWAGPNPRQPGAGVLGCAP